MIVAYAAWLIMLVLLIVGNLGATLHRSAREERLATETFTLKTAAISGLQAYRCVLTRASGEYAHLLEPFRNDPELCVFQMPDDVRVFCYHVEEAMARGPILALGARDEESRINILQAAPDRVASLPGVTAIMADQLAAYVATHPDLAPRSLNDLQAVPGWSIVDPGRLRGLVSFYGDGQVNVNTAPGGVLRLLGLSDRAIQAMHAFLAGPNGTRLDGDDRFFKGVTEIVPRLLDHGVPRPETAEWGRLIEKGILTVDSQYYRVHVRSLNDQTGRQYEIEAVLKTDSEGTIVMWQERQPA